MRNFRISIVLASVLSVIIIASGLSGCKKSDVEKVANESTDEQSEIKTIKLMNGKAEVAEQIKILADKYKEETGVTVEVESPAAGVDAQAILKGYYLGNNLPDIIVCEASSFANWEGLLVDMSDQAWVSDTDAAYVDPSYGTLGFPYTTEAIGLTYNADILAKAGVDVSTITGPEGFSKALETLDAKKEELGLKAVVGYYCEKDNLGWSAGNHIFGSYLDAGLDKNDTKYSDMTETDTPLDKDRFINFANFMALLQKYSDQDALLSGSYDEQVSNFAAGKYAFITQGSWIGTSMTGADAEAYAAAGNFEVGMLPYVFEEGIDTILTNSPSWWAVPKEGQSEEAKKFLQWCAGDSGQKILVEEAKFVSPMKSCKYVANDPFAPVVTDYLSKGKVSSWHWMNLPEGIGTNAIAPVFYDYAAGSVDAEGFYDELSKAIREF
ncbi:MAG: ABC transporter substrate-binding protein [Lachnospiraceae bacterium]|nr:ABC transporter substrate-binding protein [Lachnospiraceae bacterium]